MKYAGKAEYEMLFAPLRPCTKHPDLPVAVKCCSVMWKKSKVERPKCNFFIAKAPRRKGIPINDNAKTMLAKLGAVN